MSGEKSGRGLWAAGFGIVWIAGITATSFVFWLTISGTLWNLGFPAWLIYVTDLVGLWQMDLDCADSRQYTAFESTWILRRFADWRYLFQCLPTLPVRSDLLSFPPFQFSIAQH